MADTTNDIWNDSDGEEQFPKKRGKLGRFVLFFLTLAVVLAVVLVAAYRDGTGFDVLRRYLNYGISSQEETDEGYRYDAAAKNRFAALGDTLVVLSDTSLRLLDGSGAELWSETVQMDAPALVTGGGFTLTGWYDKPEREGGRIRVVLAE